MPNIKTIEMVFLDDLFEMNGGYVLNFSDRTFTRFFAEELQVDIDDPVYSENGGSKGKRLRCYLQKAGKAAAAQVLRALWDYREGLRLHRGADEKIPAAHARLFEIIRRLEEPDGRQPKAPEGLKPLNGAVIDGLKADLIALAAMAPQPRGYAFEKFLKNLFDAFQLQAREPFRLTGEQIDGSFLLANETYLLEAKWENDKTGVGDLHGFHGKVENKAAWSRGLFVSYTGFTDVGLEAFGRGKRVICMDGLDLFETLQRGLSLSQVLEMKVRRAAETGNPFIRVSELFP